MTIRTQRIIKVWLYILVMHVVISAIALTLTGEPRSIFVIAAVNVALGCLGTMIAILTPKRIR